jgi:hypothetical protein
VENGATIVPIVTHRAVRRAKHNREILEYLLKAGADPNTYICNMSGKILIPLEVAVSDNDIKTAQLLVRHGALIDNNYILPLIRSIEMARSLRLQLDRNSILCFLLHHFKDKVWSPILHGQLLSFYIQEGKITLDLDFLSKLLKENQIEMLKYLIIWSVPPIETQVLIELSALAWDSTGLSGLDLIWRNRFLVF